MPEDSSNSESEPQQDIEHVPEPEREPESTAAEPVPKTPVCNSFCCTGSEIFQPTDSDVLKKTERMYGLGKMRAQGLYYRRCIRATHGSTFVARILSSV